MLSARREKVADLEACDIALLTYFTNELSGESADAARFRRKFPFLSYLFTAEELEDRLRELSVRGFLTVEVDEEKTGYALAKNVAREEVVNAGHVTAFVYNRATSLINEIPLVDFAALAESQQRDPCLIAFKSDLRVSSREHWWDSICTFAKAYRDVASLAGSMYDFVGALARDLDLDIVGWESRDREEVNKEWARRGKLDIALNINNVTPWTPVPCQMFFVHAASFSTSDKSELMHKAWEALLKQARIQEIIVPLGEIGQVSGDVLRSMHGALFVPDDLKTIMLAKQPKVRFRELLRARIDIRLLSPYHPRGKVEQGMFFGRDLEVRRITGHPETSYAVYGGRRSGKTSLLEQLARIFQT